MSPKRWLGISIAVFWLLMMGLLWRREFGIQRLDSAPVAVDPSQRTESWLTIRLTSGQRVGGIHLRTGPEERQGATGSRLDVTTEMQLNLLGKATDLQLGGHVWRSVTGKRLEFEIDVRSADYDFHLTGTVADGQLLGQIHSAGEVLPLELPISEDLLLGSGFGAALQFPVLNVGDEFLLDSLDPLTLSRGTAKVRCLAEETLWIGDEAIVTRRLSVKASGIESLAWVDARGEVVRAETPFGLVLERTPAEEVARGGRAVAEPTEPMEGDDFLALTSIQPSGGTPFRGARRMTVRLSGFDEALDLPSGAGQQALGDGVYRLMATGGAGAEDASGDPESLDKAPYLAADAFVQSDHPTLRQQAKTIVEGVDDPRRRALLVHDWVFAQLDKEAVLSIPSALEVLEKRRGDCNEHTVLFTALTRALEIPTKIAIGLVWSDELAGFYYHAWPEVWIDGRWYPMDPTLDQVVADATHLKLLEGGIETWPRLIPYLGRLQIDVLDVR